MDHERLPAVFTVTVNTPGGHSQRANTTRGTVALFKATRATGVPRGVGGGQTLRLHEGDLVQHQNYSETPATLSGRRESQLEPLLSTEKNPKESREYGKNVDMLH